MIAAGPNRIVLPLRDYDLAATLNSGQAFRWSLRGRAWEGIIGAHWVRLRPGPDQLEADTAVAVPDWQWLEHYLQTGADLQSVLAAFPDDAPMRAAVAACRGLRLLRQDPWECLASFICSSTKQIVQIRQIVELLCTRFGEPVAVPPGHPPTCGFPSAARLAGVTEAELRACKMGFRAPHLLAAARQVSRGELDLGRLEMMNTPLARGELLKLPGVGPKIADCVLLFACGRADAFPRDVWVNRALRELYFPGRRPAPARLREFSRTHFGPFAGYAQQYLFHYIRVHKRHVTGQDAPPT
jgi:N-glycosylase/DNA lyase